MKMLDDEKLNALLAMAEIGDPPPDLSANVMRRTASCEQKKGLLSMLRSLLADIAQETFGSAGDIPLYNLRWRTAGAFAALMLGFYAGYGVSMDMDETAYGAYIGDEDEEMDII